MNKKSRRTRLSALMLAAILGAGSLIAGCSGNADEQKEVDAAEDAADSSNGNTDADGMRTVMTDKGEVKIPVHPKKIVSDYYLGELLAVDTKPVIASPYALNNPYLADDIEGIEPMNITSAETSQEMIAEAQPDLILTITEADYEKYSKIAPTVYIEDGKRSDEELFLYIADLVGKTDEAQAYLDAFKKKAEDSKQEVQDIVGDRTVSIVEIWPQQIYSMGSHFARGGEILYNLWGLKAPEVVQKEMVDGDTAYETISLEALPEYTGDYILYGVLSDTDPDFVEDSQIWNNLPAVKNGNVLPYEQVAWMHRDPITQSKQLDALLEFFRTHKDAQ